MKSINCLVLVLLVCLGAARADAPILRVTAVGTVTVEVAAAGGGTKRSVSVLDNERLYAEFGAAKADYALVYNNGKLQLYPKHGGLDPITIFTSTDGHQLTNTAAQSGLVMGPVSSAQATGLFKDFAGTLFGKVSFAEGNQSRSVDVVGAGTNPAPTGVAVAAHLKFKIVTNGPFIP